MQNLSYMVFVSRLSLFEPIHTTYYGLFLPFQKTRRSSLLLSFSLLLAPTQYHRGIPQLFLKFKPPCPKSNSSNDCKCLPEASTCASILLLPLHFQSVEEMFESFVEAFEHVKKHGFGKS